MPNYIKDRYGISCKNYECKSDADCDQTDKANPQRCAKVDVSTVNVSKQ